ncbi:MAG: ABC-2 transporter permease [Gemmiger sp.]|nr:ABC-2 transporter permease [Gemmiger sp.]
MSGLLYKDFITIINSYKLNALLVLGVYLGVAFVSDTYFLLYAMIFLMGLYPLTCLAFDEASHWDVYARTLPVKTWQLVGCKYILGLSFMAGGCAVALLMGVLIDIAKQRPVAAQFPSNLAGCLASFSVVLVYYAISFPLSYKIGSSKARSTVMLVMAALFGGVFVLFKSGLVPTQSLAALGAMSDAQGMLLLAGVTGAALLVFAISWAISTQIYRRKAY